MKKLNTKGAIDFHVVVIVVLVLALAGVSFWRIRSYQLSKAKDTTKSTTLKENENLDAKEADTAEEVNEKEDNKEETGGTAPTPSTPAASTITFNKGGGSLQGDVVKVSATTENSQTGTCTYSFTLGNSSVVKSNYIADSRTCYIEVPLSVFPKNGDWYFTLSFTGKNVTGTGGGYVITINPQPRQISFTKGGGSLQGDYVVVSSNLSETVSGGTCTYIFKLSSNTIVKKQNSVTDGKRCANTIPKSAFPKSGNYSYSLSFKSNDGLIYAIQSAFPITIN